MDRLIETRHITAADYRHISVPGGQQQDGDSWLFLPQATGGSLPLPGDGGRQLYWQLQTHSTSTLSLSELSLAQGQVSRGLQLQIQDQVFPAVAVHVDSAAQRLRICLVLASKAVAVLTLPLSVTSGRGSILDRFGQGGGGSTGWRVMQLGPQLSAVGLPSALAVADAHLCITGSSGSTVCISMEALASGTLQDLPPEAHAAVFSLDPSGFVAQVKRRIGLAGSVPAVAAAVVDIPRAKHSSLLVVHEDGNLYQWLVGQHRQGMYQQLTTGTQGKQTRPNRVCVCYPQPGRSTRSSGWDVLLVFDLGLPDRGAQSDIRVLPLRLQQEADQYSTANRLEPMIAEPKRLLLERPDAALVDAKLVGQQLLLLCSTSSGTSFVVSYGVGGEWNYHGPAQLLQQKAADWGGHQEVWSAALAAFPGDIDPGSHVSSQLLVPGQLCGDSLRQTLAYFGGQLGATQLAESSMSQVQACVTAAVQLIQARNPGYSTARCWHTLFAKYCELWQQQHSLMSLWAGSGGWVGAVRAGGLLTVLRGVTPAEALGQESAPAVLKHVIRAAGMSDTSSNHGVAGGSAGVATVCRCLDSLGEVLGQPALRVMTQLVMAGVPVESRLLPVLVQLMLQGPPLQQQEAGKTGFGSSSSSSAASQQQLLQWRQLRQARLLEVHEQLAELPHALETLAGFVDLAVRAATQAASQLQPPAAAAADEAPPLALSSLVSSLAVHSLRATCATLQKLLLLLGYISHVGSLGSAPLTTADHAAIAADLIAPLATALRSAAAALWLCKAPASVPVPGLIAGLRTSSGLPGPLPGLRAAGAQAAGADSPSTGQPAANGTAAGAEGAGSSGTLGTLACCWRYPLSAHLLPSFWQQQHLAASGSVGASLHHMADQLAVWLMLGAETADAADAAVPGVIDEVAWYAITGRTRNAEQTSGPRVHTRVERALRSSQGLAGRAVLMGYRLFNAGEYAAMQRLVRLVGGGSPSEAGLQYILGLSIACSMHGDKGMADSQLDLAVGHLFRAAAGLCSSEAGPLRVVLQLLRRQQCQQQQASEDGGSPAMDLATTADVDMESDEPLPTANGDLSATEAAVVYDRSCLQQDKHKQQRQHRQEALLRLQFERAVMLLFEQKGVREGALAFARAALSAVDTAYGHHQPAEKLQQQAHLWSSIFNMAFDLGLVEDAYTAALSNPQHAAAEDKIRRLVLALVEQGHLQLLLSLPWAGVLKLQRDKLIEPVPVVEVVIDRLVSSACFSQQRGLSLEPLSSYQVLYDFLLAWGNYKHAAAAMLAFARRLRAAAASTAAGSIRGDAQQLNDVAVEVQAAYDSSISLLQLLDPTDAWIDPTQRLLQQYQAPAPNVRSSSRPAAVRLANTAGSPFMAAPGQPAAGKRSTSQPSAEQALQEQQRPRLEQRQPDLPAVLTLPDLQQEAAVFIAAVALHQRGSGLEVSALMGHGLDVGWLFDQLVGQGLYPEALQLAHALYSGQQLLQQLEVVAAEVAGQCADMQHGSQQQFGVDSSGSNLQQEGFDDSSLFEGAGSRGVGVLRSSLLTPAGPGYLRSEAAAAWTKLRALLGLYDSFDCLAPDAGVTAAGLQSIADTAKSHKSRTNITVVGARLRLAAIDGVLTAQPRMALPAWLLQPFQPSADDAGMAGTAADAAALLRKYMEHWRLVDAAELVLGYLQAWQDRSSLQRVHSTAVWLPMQDLELLHASLQDGARRAREKGATTEADVLGGCAEALQSRLKQHVDLVKSDWGQLQMAVR